MALLRRASRRPAGPSPGRVTSLLTRIPVSASKSRKADNDRLKPKAGELPADVKYYAAQETPDVWLAYPWECETSIEEHDADRVKNFVP
jgi:hypothetical protein